MDPKQEDKPETKENPDKAGDEIDPDEITVSAFECKDKFSPKKYVKHKSSGKVRSFICYSKSII